MAGFKAVLAYGVVAGFAIGLPSVAAAQAAPQGNPAGQGRVDTHRYLPDAADPGPASRARPSGGHAAMLSLEKKRDRTSAAQGHATPNSVDPGSRPFAPPSASPK